MTQDLSRGNSAELLEVERAEAPDQKCHDGVEHATSVSGHNTPINPEGGSVLRWQAGQNIIKATKCKSGFIPVNLYPSLFYLLSP